MVLANQWNNVSIAFKHKYLDSFFCKFLPMMIGIGVSIALFYLIN